jgi:uncharacterized membrane protein
MRFLGHPVHPLVVAFPIALLALTPLWDGATMLDPRTARARRLLDGARGLVGGGLALVTGLADFIGLKEPSPGLTNAALRHRRFRAHHTELFVVAFVLRGGPAGEPGVLVIALELIGALALAVTGWLGGHLVFRFGVGVEKR